LPIQPAPSAYSAAFAELASSFRPIRPSSFLHPPKLTILV
jgi:hypothetical protein